MHIPRHTCGDQRTTLWGRFSPFFFMWIPGIELRSSGLRGKSISLDSSICFCLCCFCNVRIECPELSHSYTLFLPWSYCLCYFFSQVYAQHTWRSHIHIHRSIHKDHRFNVYKHSSEKTNHYCWCFVTCSHTKWLYIS